MSFAAPRSFPRPAELLRRHFGGDSEFRPGNCVELLESGVAYFPALIAAIADAREEVHLETYIFADDVIGRQIVGTLCAAVRRGVAVRVLVDGFGAREFHDHPALGMRLVRVGGEVLVYRPDIARFALSRQRLRRLHRKLVVIDGHVGFIGGINVIDDYDMGTTPEQIPPRFDYALRIEGPVVDDMHESLREVWQLVRWATFASRPPAPEPLRRWTNPATLAMRPDLVSARFVQRDSLRFRHAIEVAYLEAIRAAKDEIVIANAYFLPGRRFRRELQAAVKRGVRVTLLLQGRVEYVLMHYATLGMYRLLTRSGIRIFEYRSSFLHAKVAVIDGQWATVGSSNIDPFSLLLAREANVVIRDRVFAGRLRASLTAAIARGGIEVTRTEIRAWPWWLRWLTQLAYGGVRAVIRLGGKDPDVEHSA
ncbi:MAG: cardiolipin synthase ClsB [Rhodocyclaceae bacterium]|nr:cardiolipin synthase ClsB [Rhodocyclaceae bacterium]